MAQIVAGVLGVLLLVVAVPGLVIGAMMDGWRPDSMEAGMLVLPSILAAVGAALVAFGLKRPGQ